VQSTRKSSTTALAAVGDLQGCADALRQLLAAQAGPTRWIFVGDIVNRGPESLASLRLVRSLCEAGDAVALLGNHDLHLLAVAAGIRPLHHDDTLAAILEAPDRAELLDWLRHRPLAHFEAGALFVHAGVLPQWSAQDTLAVAEEVEASLRGARPHHFLQTMYGNTPARWHDALAGADRLRCAINALTRIRFVAADGAMDLKTKGGPGSAPAGFMPWYDHPQRKTHPARGGVPVVFGHWSALGLMLRDDAICLDSGCVWGGALTALAWPDRSVQQVNCPQVRMPAVD
jgi:bis(5'-nucleosyl)-tetraphosphatase (symmetrical)